MPSKCDQCGKCFKDNKALKRHVGGVHTDERPYQCQQCRSTFKTQEHLKHHLREVHTDERQCQCQQCPSTFKTPYALKQHLREVHTDERQCQCEQCPSTFKTPYALTKHLRRVHTDKTFQCSQCTSSFKTQDDLKKHLRTVHTDKTFQCSQCRSSFKTPRDLKIHIRGVHTDERPIQCSQCPSSFKSNWELKRHVRGVHTAERQFPCSQCPSSFKTQDDLTRHVGGKHTDERPIQCSQCPSSFKSNRELKRHIRRVHTDERPIQCSQCPSSFKSNRELKRHIRGVHTAERSYQCSQCTSSFNYKSALKRHMEYVHRLTLCGERLELCESNCKYCGNGFFKSKQLLKCHERKCNERNDWKCINCEEVFVEKKDFVSHVRKFCPKRKLNFHCSCCKSTEGYDPENEIQVLEHVMTCKPPTRIQKYRCSICDHKFLRKTLSLHIQDELLHSRLFEDIECKFECISCEIRFPAEKLLKLHNENEHPLQTTIISEWNKGDQDLDDLQMTPEKKELLIVERKRIREIGMDGFAFKGKLPSHQCYVCRRPWHDRPLMKCHIEACEQKFGLEAKKLERPRQEPISDEDLYEEPVLDVQVFKTKGRTLKRKFTAKTLQQLHDQIVFDFKKHKTIFRRADYWDNVEREYKIEPGYVFNKLSTIIRDEPELKEFFKDQLDEIQILEPPPKKIKIAIEIDISEQVEEPDLVPVVDDEKASRYFRKKKLSRIPKEPENLDPKRFMIPRPTNYDDLSLWVFKGQTPQHRCENCRRPFLDKLLKDCHAENCGNHHDLPNDYIDEEHVGSCELILHPGIAWEMKEYVRLATKSSYRINILGMEEYWKELQEIHDIPWKLVKKWHTTFTSREPHNQALFDRMLQEILARQDKENEKKKEKSKGPRFVLVT